MDNKDPVFDRAKFNAVWRRVMPEASEYDTEQKAAKQTEPDDARQLREFMDGEAQDARAYCTLAAMCFGNTRQTLLHIAADERCHIKKLKAGYFILTGAMYEPPASCPLIYSVPETLRSTYKSEKEAACAYRSAASMTPDKELADTYLALADNEARHWKLIGCIIENMM